MLRAATDFIRDERHQPYFTFFIIYLSFFLDNVLLTVVVPIIPDYLHSNSLKLLSESSSPIFKMQLLPTLHQDYHDNISYNSYIAHSNASKRFTVKEVKKTVDITKSGYMIQSEGTRKIAHDLEKIVIEDVNSTIKNIEDVNSTIKNIARDGYTAGDAGGRNNKRYNMREKKMKTSNLEETNGVKNPRNNVTDGKINRMNMALNVHQIKLIMENTTIKSDIAKIKRIKNGDYEYSGKPTTETQKKEAENKNQIATTKSSKGILSKGLNEQASDTSLDSDELERENVSIGILLSLKALVQLALNPLVGMWTAKVGYRVPILVGSLNLLIASLLFSWGASFWSLAVARAVQGAGSAALGVAGMCLAADLFTHDAARSRAMGILLGSVALGVLVGYPFGGVTYAFSNKSAPFLIIAAFVLFSILLQLLFIDFTVDEQAQTQERHHHLLEAVREWRALLRDRPTAVALGAVFTSTCAMAVLEPCLPIWLMTHFKPEKWQLGTVFVPDSAGYLIATNVFGAGARALGRARVSVTAIAVVGISAIMIPSATSLRGLLLPHACLGSALGAADAALVPALAARLAPSRTTRLGALFSLHQTAVSAAYFVAPILGGELTHLLGFSWCLRLVGGFNILYCVLLLQTFRKYGLDDQFPNSRLEEQSTGSVSERLAPHAVITYSAMHDVQ